MRGAIPPLPQYVFMAWCLVKRRDNFIFTLFMVCPTFWPSTCCFGPANIWNNIPEATTLTMKCERTDFLLAADRNPIPRHCKCLSPHEDYVGKSLTRRTMKLHNPYRRFSEPLPAPLVITTAPLNTDFKIARLVMDRRRIQYYNSKRAIVL
jgi:hypothetical protein